MPEPDGARKGAIGHLQRERAEIARLPQGHSSHMNVHAGGILFKIASL